jgi:hypothetical protein
MSPFTGSGYGPVQSSRIIDCKLDVFASSPVFASYGDDRGDCWVAEGLADYLFADESRGTRHD